MPVTPQNMSFVSVVSVGLLAFVIVLWYTTKRKVFKGPHIDYELLKERRMEAIHSHLIRSDLEGVDPVTPESTHVEPTYKH